MKNMLGLILISLALVIFGFRIAKKIEFNQNISGYLKRAADANTVELAKAELSKVINYLEANNLTSGHTSVFYETPDEDIDFWYRNLKASLSELENLKTESALERTNVLIKLRETLVDSGKKTRVTVPKGLAVYPHNALWGTLTLGAAIAIFASFILFAMEYEEKKKNKVVCVS